MARYREKSVNARKISKMARLMPSYPIPDIFFRVGIPLSILYYRTGSTKLVRDRMYTRIGFVFYTNAGEESRESVQLETKHCLERFIILETFLTERIKFTLVNHEYEDLQFV